MAVSLYFCSESAFYDQNEDSFFDAFFDEGGRWKKEARPQPWDTGESFYVVVQKSKRINRETGKF